MGQRKDAWTYLMKTDADIALLQEAKNPPENVKTKIQAGPAQWKTAGF